MKSSGVVKKASATKYKVKEENENQLKNRFINTNWEKRTTRRGDKEKFEREGDVGRGS